MYLLIFSELQKKCVRRYSERQETEKGFEIQKCFRMEHIIKDIRWKIEMSIFKTKENPPKKSYTTALGVCFIVV